MFVSDIAEALGRTKTSVTSAADRIGLAGKARHLREDVWTADEVEFLRSHFHAEKVEWIAKRLGRSAVSVSRKRAALGMPAKAVRVIEGRPIGDDLLAMYGSMTVPQIAEKYGYNKNTVRSWIERTI
jgi:predicted transcriptional regulator